MAQAKQLKQAADNLTSIEDFATAWGVTTKTVQNWVEFTYQGFEILLPSSGPFPDWAIELLTFCAKHVSEKSALYYAETNERRRLKGTEYVKKIRALREEGHFENFQKFQNFQNFQNFQTNETAQELEDDALAALGSIARGSDSDLSRIKRTIEEQEDAEIEELAAFIENRDNRKLSKLARRLQTGKPSQASIGEAIDVSFKRLPGS